MVYLINKLTIRKNNNNDTYFVYHGYDAINDIGKKYYSGRWYDMQFKFNKESMNEKKQYIHTTMMFEHLNTFEKYEVETKIYFNESGWRQLNSFITK